MALPTFRRWRNGETFTARDYIYERDAIVEEINRLAGFFNGTSDAEVNTITIGEHLLEWDDTHGTLELTMFNNVPLHIGQEQYFYAKAYQENITIGDPVMFAGVEGNHFRIKVATPEALNANPEYFIGIAAQTLLAGEFGYVIEFGHLEGVNLPEATYSPGDILWFDSTNGGWTTTKPGAGKAKIRAAAVIAVNQNVNQTYTGEIFVRPSILENADFNGTNVFTINDEPTDQANGDLWFDNN